MIKIDKNVPMPEKGTASNPRYPYKNMKIGDTILKKNIAIRKPAIGISPKDLDSVIGQKVIRNCKKGEPITKLDYKDSLL